MDLFLLQKHGKFEPKKSALQRRSVREGRWYQEYNIHAKEITYSREYNILFTNEPTAQTICKS